MRNPIQRELDRAEEYLLTILFGDARNPILSKKIQLFLISKDINFDDFINHKIQLFEEFSYDFMNENGYYIGEKLSKALALQFPEFNTLVLPDIKPIDFFKMINNLIGLEAIGKFIQTI